MNNLLNYNLIDFLEDLLPGLDQNSTSIFILYEYIVLLRSTIYSKSNYPIV